MSDLKEHEKQEMLHAQIRRSHDMVRSPRPSSELAASFHHQATVISSMEEVQRKSSELKDRISLQIEMPDLSIPTKPSIVEKPAERLDIEYDFHVAPLEDLASRFGTNLTEGLTSEKASQKLKTDGPNSVAMRSYRWIWDIIYYYFGGICLLLWPAVILCILCYEPFGAPDPDPTNLGLAAVVFVVIIVQGSFSLYQDYSSSKVMKSINAMLPQQATVIRDGKEIGIQLTTLVCGDIVKVEVGNRVPADLRLIKVQNLKVDTSMLTGESDPITCTLNVTDSNYMLTKNLLFMGTGIVEGVGYGIVVGTGNRTVMGKIAKMASKASKGASTLRVEALRMVVFIAIIGILSGVLLLIWWGAFLRTKYPGFMSTSAMISNVIGIIIAYVPEGFPLALALTLTFIARRMNQLNVLVKRVSTVETLGAMNVIASDKTGTLTQNRMHVADVYTAMRSTPAKKCAALFEANDIAFTEHIRCLSLCNRAEFTNVPGNRISSTLAPVILDSTPLEQHQPSVTGDASDTAFLLFCQEFVNVPSLRQKHFKLAEIPFNSKAKYMLTIIHEDANSATLYMKGAAEIILSRCTRVLDVNGAEIPLTADIRSKFTQEIERLANDGERVLATCRLLLDPIKYSPSYTYDTENVNFPMDGLCLLGLVALMDPPRPDVPAAVQTLKKAGVRVMMVTGDHPSTAVSIARMIDIISSDAEVYRVKGGEYDEKLDLEDPEIKRALVIHGEDVPALHSRTWDVMVKRYKELVFARTTPEHKLLIVKEYQRRGCIVAATGDGTNDAPAMKQANVGVAMGSGTDIAREAADIVLLDNRFSSITFGVKYGRLAFDNLRKIVTYVLPSGNWSEMIPTFLTCFLGLPLPLSPFLCIVICCATDVAPSLSLVRELPEGDIMLQKPRVESGERLVDVGLFVRAFLFLGSIECTGALVMYFSYFYWYANMTPVQMFLTYNQWTDGYLGYTQNELNEFVYVGQSIYFIAVVIQQVGQLLTTRLSRYNFYQQWFWTNPNLFLGIFIEILVAVGVIYLPLFNTLFKTRQPPVQFWFFPMALMVVIFVLNELRKGFMRCVRSFVAKHRSL